MALVALCVPSPNLIFCGEEHRPDGASVYRPHLHGELQAAASKQAAESEVEEDDSGDEHDVLADASIQCGQNSLDPGALATLRHHDSYGEEMDPKLMALLVARSSTSDSVLTQPILSPPDCTSRPKGVGPDQWGPRSARKGRPEPGASKMKLRERHPTRSLSNVQGPSPNKRARLGSGK